MLPNTHSKEVIEIPNLITKELAEELKTFALNTDISGLHRRGSKTPWMVSASFYTCLVFRHNSKIYDILDPAWETYISQYSPGISYIEPYEIKSYIAGDKFGMHNDISFSKKHNTQRTINLIVQLSDESDYEGGDLIVGDFVCSRKFGTGIFFPAEQMHCVTEIVRGNRLSLIAHAWSPVSI